MGKIDIFRHDSVAFRNAFVTLRSYALYRLQLAHAVGQCILQRGDSDALFPNGKDLFALVHYQQQNRRHHQQWRQR